MKNRFYLSVWLLFLLSGCGFHLQHETEIPPQFQIMTFQSNDPYGTLSREIRTILAKNKVTLVSPAEDTKSYPSLYILGSELNRDTISIYQDGKAAEYQLTLTVNAQVIIAGQDIYPITVKVFRTFFDNPATALAKSTEQNLIEHEMYNQAAKQIIGKLKSVNAVDQKTNTL